jgi:hypothetical protein
MLDTDTPALVLPRRGLVALTRNAVRKLGTVLVGRERLK